MCWKLIPPVSSFFYCRNWKYVAYDTTLFDYFVICSISGSVILLVTCLPSIAIFINTEHFLVAVGQNPYIAQYVVYISLNIMNNINSNFYNYKTIVEIEWKLTKQYYFLNNNYILTKNAQSTSYLIPFLIIASLLWYNSVKWKR